MSEGARKRVVPQRPPLLLSQDHDLCAGCGEPLALRALCEAIVDVACADRAIGRDGREAHAPLRPTRRRGHSPRSTSTV